MKSRITRIFIVVLFAGMCAFGLGCFHDEDDDCDHDDFCGECYVHCDECGDCNDGCYDDCNDFCH